VTRFRLTLCVLLLSLVLPAGARALMTAEAEPPRPGPPASSRPLVGIGEQDPAMFSDPRLSTLGIRYARLSIGWDALESRAEAARLAVWLSAARADGVQPLISFEHSWRASRARRLPSAARFAAQFRRLHSLYPWVTDFAAWNEANYCGQPTCGHAALVAAYYLGMRRVCPSCNILAAELLDVGGMISWVHSFRRALAFEPPLWGLHNYVGANRFQTASTVALLRATRGTIWFTETAGVVARHNHSAHDFPESPSHAAAVTRFVFDRLARLSPRIARVYLYEWNAAPRSARVGRTGGARLGHPPSWDSALIGPRGTPRPAFWVLVKELARLGQLPSTPAARALLAQAGG
jgi:hypothetical protein